MSPVLATDPKEKNAILALVQNERTKALSIREWKHRLAGLGLAIKNTEHGTFIASLLRGTELCRLPSNMA